MKKKLITIVMALVMALTCISFTACAKNESYKFSKLYVNMYGMEVTMNVNETPNALLSSIFGEEALTEDFMTLDLNADKTFALSFALMDQDAPEGEETPEEDNLTYSWEKKDGKVILSISGEMDGETQTESIELIEEDGMLVFDMASMMGGESDGMVMKIYLVKA